MDASKKSGRKSPKKVRFAIGREAGAEDFADLVMKLVEDYNARQKEEHLNDESPEDSTPKKPED